MQCAIKVVCIVTENN